MRTVRAALLLFAASVAPMMAAAPVWDNSGNGQLNGTYYFRQVLYVADATGTISRAFAFYGNITFTGTGTYTVSNGVLLDSSSAAQNYNPTGTYSISASGYGFLSSGLVNGASTYFLVSNKLVVGGSTESGYNDMFIAAPVTASFSNSNFQGTYTVTGYLPGGNPAAAADVTYQLAPDGAGHLGTVNMTGYFGGTGATAQSQSTPSVPYSFSNGAATITFPASNTANFYASKEYMYMSPDTNFIFGGSPTGYDMFVGVKNASGSTPVSGLYYELGLDEDESQLASGYAVFDTYYGVFNAYQGSTIGHERLLVPGQNPEGNTYHATYPTSIAGNYTDASGTVKYTVGAGGIRVGFGVGPYLAMSLALPYTPPAPTGAVYVDPTGIVNTASSAPFTAGISPGGFITFYNGVNLAPSTVVASTTPFPTSLGGVKVLIDGIPAPIYYVSPTSISVIVPYAVSNYAIATIQVVNNSVASNTVTAFVNTTTPGVFTAPSGGIGYAKMLHGDYSEVTTANPAKPGETVAVYLTGLGNVFPPNGDGAIGPYTEPFSLTNATIAVYVNGVAAATPVPYAGLAPYLAGLYQVNFQVPATATAGDNTLGIAGPDAYSSEALIPIGTAAASAVASPTTQPVPASVMRRRLPRFNSATSR